MSCIIRFIFNEPYLFRDGIWVEKQNGGEGSIAMRKGLASSHHYFYPYSVPKDTDS